MSERTFLRGEAVSIFAKKQLDMFIFVRTFCCRWRGTKLKSRNIRSTSFVNDAVCDDINFKEVLECQEYSNFVHTAFVVDLHGFARKTLNLCMKSCNLPHRTPNLQPLLPDMTHSSLKHFGQRVRHIYGEVCQKGRVGQLGVEIDVSGERSPI